MKTCKVHYDETEKTQRVDFYEGAEFFGAWKAFNTYQDGQLDTMLNHILDWTRDGKLP